MSPGDGSCQKLQNCFYICWSYAEKKLWPLFFQKWCSVLTDVDSCTAHSLNNLESYFLIELFHSAVLYMLYCDGYCYLTYLCACKTFQSDIFVIVCVFVVVISFQCFDTVGWAAGQWRHPVTCQNLCPLNPAVLCRCWLNERNGILCVNNSLQHLLLSKGQLANPGSPGKWPLKQRVCFCVCCGSLEWKLKIGRWMLGKWK